MAVNEDVTIRVTTDVAAALEGWRQIAEGPLALEKALQRISDLEGQRSKGMARELENIVGKWTSIALLINKAQEAMRSYFDTAQRLRQESVDATRDIDTASRQYAMAAGIRSRTEQYQLAQQRISQVAQQTQTNQIAAFDAARLLATFGFSREDQQGPALRELLEFQSAVDLSGRGDAGQLAKSVLQVAQRSRGPGQQLRATDIRQIGAATMQLMGSGVGFGEGQLGEYAAVARAVREYGIDFPTGLSMWAAAREDRTQRQSTQLFKALFDPRERPGEEAQRAALRQRGDELRSASGLSYEDILELASESMVQREEASASRYQVSGYREGTLDPKTVYQDLISGVRKQTGGPSPFREGFLGWEYAIKQWVLGGPEAAVESIVAPSDPFARPQRTRDAVDQLRKRALGQEGFTSDIRDGQQPLQVNVRLTGTDGRDIPAEVEAVGIQGR